jgi:hypothetical protein
MACRVLSARGTRGKERAALKSRAATADGMGMNPPRPTSTFALCALLAACSSTDHKVADFGANPEIYAGLGYKTKQPGERTVFVGPVVDARRDDVLPAGLGGFPIVYDNESRWERPVPAMLDDVLHSDMLASRLFSSFAPNAKVADIIVMPSLVTFTTGSVELDAGARALSDLGVRVQVYGPIADGKRPLLLDQVYGDREMSDASMRTPSRVLLTGRVLRATMQKLMRGLDGANVSRAGLPTVDDGLPATPSPVGPSPTGPSPVMPGPTGPGPVGPPAPAPIAPATATPTAPLPGGAR